ncbi:MAG: hypothetical protein JO219_03200 [Candidatus Eremiobacteraeota bacterium]|nr:hypothetical protein [Candidatus Eremiobacteraeota bacterium]MBV8365656.1 hypothetical protein [Candidatus Eremiobacteraeota bacterium]
MKWDTTSSGWTGSMVPATSTPLPSPPPTFYQCNLDVQIASGIKVGTYQPYTWGLTIYNSAGQVIGGGTFDTAYVPQRNYIQAACSNNLNNCPVLDVTDMDLNKVVSGTPPPSPTKWVVGLKKNLSVAIRPGSGTGSYNVINLSWTPPPNAYESYNFGANTTTAPVVLSYTDLVSSPFGFYWISGDNLNPQQFGVNEFVQRTDGLETASVTTLLSYLVMTPSSVNLGASYSATQFGVFEANGAKAVSSGTILNLPTSAGIDTAFTATAPQAITGYMGGGYTGAGYFAASQVLVSSSPAPTATPPLADACAIFSTNASRQANPVAKVAAGSTVTWHALDAPAQFTLPASGHSLTYGDSFVDYFIFRPTGKNAIWVTLGTLSWSWGATITNNAGKYTLSNVTNSSQATSSTSTNEPTWNAIYNGGSFVCATLPSQ